MTLDEMLKKAELDLTDVKDAWKHIYNTRFASYFEDIDKLHKAMTGKVNKISDDELEQILTDTPLQLFAAAEELNQLRLEYEVLKLRVNNQKSDVRSEVGKVIDLDTTLTKQERQDAVRDVVNYKVEQSETILRIYQTAISRVENQISFTKELIMGAKKVWDSRRASETSNPIREIPEVDPLNLPDYNTLAQQHPVHKPTSGVAPKEYIK